MIRLDLKRIFLLWLFLLGPIANFACKGPGGSEYVYDIPVSSHKVFACQRSSDLILPVDSVRDCQEHPRIQLKIFPTRVAFFLSGGNRKYQKTINLNCGSGEMKPFAEVLPVFIDFKNRPDGVLHCKFTTQDSIFDASELQVSGKSSRQKEKAWVNFLLGNFLYGQGPENIIFPVNGEVSMGLKHSSVVKSALRKFQDSLFSLSDGQHLVHRSEFFIKDLILTLNQPLSIRHYVGSVDIILAPESDSTISLTIFNVTSVTSADYSTHYRRPSKWPKAIPRQKSPHPLSNTSQVYQLIINSSEIESSIRKMKFAAKD